MNWHTFKVTTKVRGQSRPRFTKSGHAFKSKQDKEYEQIIRNAYIESGGQFLGDNVPIQIHVYVFRSLPKSTPKKIKEQPDTNKPDIDNIIKSVLDALNGVAFADDSQVICVNAYKFPRARRDEYIEVMVGVFNEEGF